MNRAQRRAAARKGLPSPEPAGPIKIGPETIFGVRVVEAQEATGPDGIVRKAYLLQLVTPDGVALVETTEFGPQPVAFETLPIMVRRGVLLAR